MSPAPVRRMGGQSAKRRRRRKPCRSCSPYQLRSLAQEDVAVWSFKKSIADAEYQLVVLSPPGEGSPAAEEVRHKLKTVVDEAGLRRVLGEYENLRTYRFDQVIDLASSAATAGLGSSTTKFSQTMVKRKLQNVLFSQSFPLESNLPLTNMQSEFQGSELGGAPRNLFYVQLNTLPVDWVAQDPRPRMDYGSFLQSDARYRGRNFAYK